MSTELDAIAKAQIEIIEAIRAQSILQYQRSLTRNGIEGGIYTRPHTDDRYYLGKCDALQGVLHTLGAIQGNVGTENELRRAGLR